MKKHYSIWLLLITLCRIVGSCKKDNQEETLPPATQTGAGTFGCKINGKVYIPIASNGTGKPNPRNIYDVGLNGLPYLYIETHQFSDGTSLAGVDITFFNVDNLGNYQLNIDKFRLSVGSINILGSCGISAVDSTIKRWGGGVITRLDIANHIISGTFDCKFKRVDCDTVRITDGRFDIKF